MKLIIDNTSIIFEGDEMMGKEAIIIENQQNCSQMYLRSASEVKKLSVETNQMLNQARKKLLDEVIQDDDIYFINKQISVFDLVKHIFSKSLKY